MFDNYEFGLELRDAHISRIEQSEENMIKILDWTKNPKNILFMGGSVGTGKSYLASSFYNYFKENNKNIRVYSETHLFAELKLCMHLPSYTPEYRMKNIAEAEYFILDDFGANLSEDPAKSEWCKNMLFQFLDSRYSNSLPTLITSNLGKHEIDKIFHDRFSSRLYARKNTIINTNGPDRRQQ